MQRKSTAVNLSCGLIIVRDIVLYPRSAEKRDLVVVSILRVVCKKMSLLKKRHELLNPIFCSKDFLI